jgi:hypothetical protein
VPANIAKNHFLGKEGLVKLNCAQSVAIAFKEKYSLSEETLEAFRSFGSGKAPEGLCGAYYAAKFLLEKNKAHKNADHLEQYFIEQAGDIRCSRIRECRKLSCLGCVEKSAEYIESN